MKKINLGNLSLIKANILSSDEKKQLLGGSRWLPCPVFIVCNCINIGGVVGYDSIYSCVNKGCTVMEPYHKDCENEW